MSNMVVRTNVFALNAHRNMKNVGLEQRTASNRLSSGYRINSAADDAAGLAISETMRAQIRGLDQASRNAQDGQAMILTTEGGLEEIGNMLQRTRELLVQAANDTNTQGQRHMIEQEINQLAQEIGSMQQRVEFNTNRVLAMGPALDSAISNATADIENDGIRVSEAFALIDNNTRNVAEAREMLATLSGTMTFSELNLRQQSQVTRALEGIDFTVITGGVNTTVSTDIPANILGVNPANFELREGVGQSSLFNQAALAWHALNELAFEHTGATAQLAAAQLTTPPTDSGAVADAQARLSAANAAIDAAGFANVEDLITRKLELGGAAVGVTATFDAADDFGRAPTVSAGTPGASYSATGGASGIFGVQGTDSRLSVAHADATNPSQISAYDAARLALNSARTNVANAQAAVARAERSGDAEAIAAANAVLGAALGTRDDIQTDPGGNPANHVSPIGLALAQQRYDAAATVLQGHVDTLLDDGLRTVGSSVTEMIGALNDRDTDLADRASTLNLVRGEMLAAAEVQFDAIRDFAGANTSGDFVAFFQVGANANQGITFDFETVSRTVSSAAAVVNIASILVANPNSGGGVGRGIEVSPVISQVQESLDDVNRIRANLGAVQNRMDYTMRSLDISSENLSDSESRVRNADVAREMMRFTMANVLQQAAVSMLSQANQMPNNLLQLLR